MNNDIFMCGASREIITPAVGTALYGYRPGVYSTSVNDDLTVTATAFAKGDVRAIMLSVTVCEMATGISDDIRNKISDKTGVPFDNVLVCCTHVHSGPSCLYMAGWGDVDWDYINGVLIPKCVEASVKACANMIPAKMGIGTTQSYVGVNRREILFNGEVDFGQNPYGIFDPTMTVMSFLGLNDEPIVNLVHYGCHGTAAGCNYEITRDWAGVMVDGMEAETGILTAFILGPEGDVGPRLANGKTTGVGDISYVRQLGSVAQIDAVRAFRTIKEYRSDVEMNIIAGDVDLPYKELPTQEELACELKAYEGVNTDELRNINQLIYNRLVEIKEVYDGKRERKEKFTFRLSVLELNSVAFFAFPFELFSEIALRIRTYTKYQHALTCCCANGANYYMPTRGEILRGGYEVECFLYNGAFTLCDNSDDLLIQQSLDMLDAKNLMPKKERFDENA